MRVLKKNTADPFRNGKQEHVVAERGRPIGHGEADAFARDHSAAANEKQRRNTCNPRETVEPRCRSFWRRLDPSFANHKPINRGLRG